MALGTTLPFWPALVFTYFEPIALITGYYSALNDPSAFVTRQLPTSTALTSATVPSSAIVVTYSLANVFLLLAGLAVVCTVITREGRVTKWYLFMVACGDLGHIYASYKVMGSDVFWNFSDYNDMMVGNVLVSAFLHVNRGLTLIGAFGRVGR
ncbi:hypothetical protein BKA63DRAFT_440464 [Paraphoma chrysanthemicola]|nr:hypothetical protein BKA63DRAFT_440464 [Paraphoma chrysanthemicola]